MLARQACLQLRRRAATLFAVVALIAVATGGCARHYDSAASAQATGDSGTHGLSAERFKQAQGYSLLYDDADDVTKFRLELKLKDKSQPVASLLDDFMDYDNHLMSQLERLARVYPGVRIDLPARSDIEEKERFAIGKDYLLAFAPVLGDSGAKFERKALLFFMVFVDEQRHLTAVMADQETDSMLQNFLHQQHDKLDGLYQRFQAVLNSRYFTHPDSSG